VPQHDEVRDCYICGTKLEGNARSEEHIIPNAIGGRLKSFALLCKKCNNGLGETLDSELSDQLLPLANFLAIERERRETPSVHVVFNGKRYIRKADGNMSPVDERPTVTEDSGSLNYSITTSSLAKARRHLEGLKRRHPSIDVDAAMLTATSTTTRVEGKAKFAFSGIGGEHALRAIVKIALGYFLHVGGSPLDVPDAIATVARAGVPSVERIGSLYTVDPIPQRDLARVLHVVAIVTSASGKQVNAYVELLGAVRFAVLLSDSYAGPPISSVYAFDVCSREAVAIDAHCLVGAPWAHEDWRLSWRFSGWIQAAV
jgi:hypothetical protein